MAIKFFFVLIYFPNRSGKFPSSFVFSFLVLGTYKFKMISCCCLPCLTSVDKKPLKLLSIWQKNFPRFAILSLEMLLLSYSCIEDHAYISMGREHFMSSIAMIIF